MSEYSSTTAPNKVFATREDLAEHYKSDWHRYNLKRKEAGLAPVGEDDFKARLEAALALRQEREGKELRDGKGHLKDKKRKTKKEKLQIAKDKKNDVVTEETIISSGTEQMDTTTEEEGPPEINPLQCLFDNSIHPTLEENITYMTKKYGFFVPDREYLVDLEGFIGYCAEKVKIGCICLYCQKGFSSYSGLQQHMIDKGHCKIRYEVGIDAHDFEPFYDFSKANDEFLGKSNNPIKESVVVDADEDDEGEWEDIDDEKEDDASFDGYAKMIQTHGFGMTYLGELVLPNGRVIGHRTLSKYYNQKFAPEEVSKAVAAARRTEREKYLGYGSISAAIETSTLAMNSSEISGRLLQARGRDGAGVLVSKGGDGNGFAGYSQVSLYRYRAVVRKQRREEASSFRNMMKNRYNMNRMDKKANNIMNGVSVAHAKR